MGATKMFEEAQRISVMLKESKVLSNKDMVWFDYLYNISPEVKGALDLYRVEHICTLEEALIKAVIELSKTNDFLLSQFNEMNKGLDEKNIQ